MNLCTKCNRPKYLDEICNTTGQFHAPRSILGEQGVITVDALKQTRVHWEPSRVQIINVDSDSLNIYQTYQSIYPLTGVLYGTYVEEDLTINVNAIYETSPDEKLTKIDEIASRLGLRRVGIIRKDLNAESVMESAKEQSLHDDHCVLLTCTDKECQGWQTSVQCSVFYRYGIFAEAKEQMLICNQSLTVSNQESTEVNCEWFTGCVAVQRFESKIRGSFVRSFRLGLPPPTYENLLAYLEIHKDEPFLTAISDFHLLVFLLTQIFTDVEHLELCDMVRTQEETPQLAMYNAAFD